MDCERVDATQVREQVTTVGQRVRGAIEALPPGTAPRHHLDAALDELSELHGLLDGLTASAPAAKPRPRVCVLGAFEVRCADGRRAEWTSRKARELLKILVARRGVPSHREELMGLLWPDVEPDALRNRFSVALSVVRRALDPDRQAGDPVEANSVSVRLCLESVSVDVEDFLAAANAGLDAHASDHADAEGALLHALGLHPGPALPDEPYVAWAAPLQREVRGAHLLVARSLGERATNVGDHLAASEAYRHLLETDPFDAEAHRLLLDALGHLGATGQVAGERRRWDTLMTAERFGSVAGVLTDH